MPLRPHDARRRARSSQPAATPSGWSGGSAAAVAQLESLAAVAAARADAVPAARRRGRRVRWAAVGAGAALVAAGAGAWALADGTCAPVYSLDDAAAGAGGDSALPAAGWKSDATRCA